MHDGFVRAVRYRRGLRKSESAAGWICRIVVNEARRSRKAAAQRREPWAAEELDGAGPAEHDDAGLVRTALATLPERQRLALFLRSYADLDYTGIAEALGITRGTVSATLHAAHANLHSQLEEVYR